MSFILKDSKKADLIQFGSVPVTLGKGSEWRTIYYTSMQNIKAGDLIQVFGEGQGRNDLNYNVELAQIVEIKTLSQMSDGQEPVNGIYQSAINGWNIVPDEHYGRFSKMAAWFADSNYDVLYATLRIRCRSNEAKPNNYIVIQESQGCMFVNHYSQMDMIA